MSTELIAALPQFIKDSRAGRTREIREMMAIYVPFMAATGMRPGTEAEYLEWVGGVVAHRPWKFGVRFSMKAVRPSL